MRFSNLIPVAVALILACAAPAGAQLISENFDGVTPNDLPADWTRENANGDGYVWMTSTSYACSGNSANIHHNSVAMDDWLFSPGVALTAGWTYTLTFNYRAGLVSDPEDLTVYLGSSATSGAMTTQLIDLPSITNTTCQLATVTDFTVASSGTYYIGFWGHSAADQFYLTVDDVTLVNTGVPVELMSFDVE